MRQIWRLDELNCGAAANPWTVEPVLRIVGDMLAFLPGTTCILMESRNRSQSRLQQHVTYLGSSEAHIVGRTSLFVTMN